MKIALFFGSFNPVHNGHLALAKQLLSFAESDQVWFVLTPQNPQKNSLDLLNDTVRLQLLNLALDGEERLKACTIEFELPAPHYTINTLRELDKRYPEHQFLLLIGADNWAIFPSWKEYQTILRNYKIAVYPRKGIDLKVSADEYPQVRIMDAPLYPVSSTKIRELIKKGEEFSEFVPVSVAKYIVQNNLYK